MYDDDNPQDVHRKLAVVLLYYGLLRVSEVKTIQLKDVRLDLTENVEVDYPYATKRSAKQMCGHGRLSLLQRG